MWLKAIQAYRLKLSEKRTLEDWQMGLERQLSKPCPANSPMVFGWEAIDNKPQSPLISSSSGFHAVNFSFARRLMPQDVVKTALAERVHEIEKTQGYPVSKKEQRRMLDELSFEMLPKAFIQKKTVPIIWHESSNTVIIGSNQTAIIECFLTCWSNSLPGWQLKPIHSNQSVEQTLTAWMKHENPMPSQIQWGSSAQLTSPQNRYISIRFSGQELDNSSIHRHLEEEGFMVKSAVLKWQDKLQFTVNQDFSLSQIKTLDIEKINEPDTPWQEQILLDLALMGPMYVALIDELLDCFGGEEKQEANATTVNKETLVESY